MAKDNHHICVLGNIGAGKTTAVLAIAAELGANPFEEQFDANPYLAAFYAEPARWAGLSQLWFLAETASQHAVVRDAPGLSVQEQGIHGVYEVMTRHLHAMGAISEADSQLVATHYRVLERVFGTPDVLVRLTARNETLLDRIRARSRPFEQQITAIYLDSIEQQIERFVREWNQELVVTVDTEAVDARTPQGRAELAKAVADALPQLGPTS